MAYLDIDIYEAREDLKNSVARLFSFWNPKVTLSKDAAVRLVASSFDDGVKAVRLTTQKMEKELEEIGKTLEDSQEKVRELEEYNSNCISRLLHEARVKELEQQCEKLENQLMRLVGKSNMVTAYARHGQSIHRDDVIDLYEQQVLAEEFLCNYKASKVTND